MAPPPAAAQDLLTVGTVLVGTETAVAVPVSIADRAGTALDEGAGADREIQGFAFRVDFTPAAAVSSVTFRRGGVTADRTPVFPVVQTGPGRIVVLMSFDETTDPLGFTLGAAAPGDPVGELTFELAAPLLPAAAIDLVLESATATLINGSATLSETVGNGHLALRHGAIRARLVFTDGFESGDLAAWSAVVGG